MESGSQECQSESKIIFVCFQRLVLKSIKKFFYASVKTDNFLENKQFLFYCTPVKQFFRSLEISRINYLASRSYSIPIRNMEFSLAPIGVEIRGVDINQEISESLINQFRNEVHKHRLLIFKNQGVVSGKRHVEISKWFGDLESTFYKHPKSPDPDVFRVSNVREEGCTNVGRTGWHIDGSFMVKPFAFAIYHMVSIPRHGDTAFVPLNELIESLSPETRARWERLWMLPDRRDQTLHPLIYPHPVTKLPTLCFHLGMTSAFVWDAGTEQQRITGDEETNQILQEIHNEVVKDDRRLIYSHKWEVGDFIISDNLSVGHEATPESQYSVEDIGLRILHRTTIAGTNQPNKT